MNYDPIIVALVSCVQMLDKAEPDEVEPSFAVKVQRVVGEYLQEIPTGDQRELRNVLVRIADERFEGESAFADYLRRWASVVG